MEVRAVRACCFGVIGWQIDSRPEISAPTSCRCTWPSFHLSSVLGNLATARLRLCRIMRLFAAMFGSIGVNVISHVLVRHLVEAEARFSAEHPRT